MPPTAYILAKNEAPNIGRSVAALVASGLRVVVLDSGSTDGTQEIARRLDGEVEDYRYVDHLTAYADICAARTASTERAFILDADMIVSPDLIAEALALIESGADVVRAPIEMWWNGAPLRRGSLCPAKPFCFRGGRSYFEIHGHAEAISDDVRTATTATSLRHDDRKPFSSYLESQLRYAKAMMRTKEGASFANRLRRRTPFLIAAVPLMSYVIRGGFRSGVTGAIYALDRLIAEAIMLRESLAAKPDDRSR